MSPIPAVTNAMNGEKQGSANIPPGRELDSDVVVRSSGKLQSIEMRGGGRKRGAQKAFTHRSIYVCTTYIDFYCHRALLLGIGSS